MTREEWVEIEEEEVVEVLAYAAAVVKAFFFPNFETGGGERVLEGTLPRSSRRSLYFMVYEIFGRLNVDWWVTVERGSFRVAAMSEANRKRGYDERWRGAKDGRSEATTVCVIAL